ncbi:hypothetical protein [Actinosynnema sp. NPDC020468]|uniref:hypothetical protein n=1 Tax=Actinosynnema sp. NPDC020468 TaxID=3154488 RepID=UPI0033F3299F
MSGELQRLLAQADTSQLMRTHGGLLLSAEGRRLHALLRDQASGGLAQQVCVAIATEVAVSAMDAVARVAAHRRSLEGRDPVLDAVLAEVESNHLHQVARIQRDGAH